ncbi:MAG: DUF5667 domain-containing protein [Anaerolineae bacterium]
MEDIAETIDPELLYLLQSLRDVPDRDPRAASAGRTKFLLEACRVRATSPAATPAGPAGLLRRLAPRLPVGFERTAGAVLGAACLLMVCGMSLRRASNSLPGDSFYPLKTTVESVQLLVYGGGVSGADLRLRLAERRLTEVAELANLGRLEDMALAAAAYSDQVDAATEALESLTGAVPQRETVALASALGDRLSRNDELLSAVSGQVPEQARQSLDHARSVTAAGVEAASAILDGGGSEPTAEPTTGAIAAATEPGRSHERTATAESTATPTAEKTHARPTQVPAMTETATATVVATASATASTTPVKPDDTAVPPGQQHQADATATAVAQPSAEPSSTPTAHVPPGQAQKQESTATEMPTPVPTPDPTPDVPTATPVPADPPTSTPEPGSDPTAAPTDSAPGKSGEAPGQQKKD